MYDFVIITVLCTLHAEMTFLSNRVSDYYYINQGRTRIPGVNDGEEFKITDVSATARVLRNLIICFKIHHLFICYYGYLTSVTKPIKCDQ